jgi:hypothetical protein
MIDEIDRILAKLTAIEREIVEKRLLTPAERRRERLARRDAALRAAATTLSGTIATRAAKLSLAIGRYDGTAWRRDRRLPAMPESYAGRIAEHLYSAFQATGAAPPRSSSALRQILSTCCSEK